MKNIMLDLETFGTNPFSPIISIGAVYFDPTKTGDEAIKSQFYVTIDPAMSVAHGFRADMDTMLWWMHPDRAAAYKDWLGVAHFEPEVALRGFTIWLEGLFDGEPMPADWTTEIAMWGNGPAFDNEILRNAYKVLNMECPWKHFGDRCFRTMKNLVHTRRLGVGVEPVTVRARELSVPHEGNLHNAVVDARQQALWLCNIAHQFALDL